MHKDKIKFIFNIVANTIYALIYVLLYTQFIKLALRFSCQSINLCTVKQLTIVMSISSPPAVDQYLWQVAWNRKIFVGVMHSSSDWAHYEVGFRHSLFSRTQLPHGVHQLLAIIQAYNLHLPSRYVIIWCMQEICNKVERRMNQEFNS